MIVRNKSIDASLGAQVLGEGRRACLLSRAEPQPPNASFFYALQQRSPGEF
jgi:hypothetical protein